MTTTPKTERLLGTESRRRKRTPKACHPCRRRKVRCNYQQPCGTCTRRHHPQLCVYEKPPHQVRTELIWHAGLDTPTGRLQSSSSSPNSTSEAPVSHDVDSNPSPTDESANYLLAILDHMAGGAVASCEMDAETGQTTFVGRNSSAALFRSLLPYLPAEILPRDISVEAAFGLTNRTPSHPFASIWNTTVRITLGDILRSLPPTETCLRYYRSYQQIAHPFFPFLHDTESFEHKLCSVLEQVGAESEEGQPSSTRLAADMPRPELAEYALLFAVLASGCQFSDATSSEQLALTTRVFVACSWECLRLANFYVNPFPETIQATLILESVTCNDSNPGVAMNILGITARQVQNLGMHRKSGCPLETYLCLEGLHPLWRAVLILDSSLSVAFDRMPAGFIPKDHDLRTPLIRAPHLEFWDCMFNLHCLQIQWQSTVSHDIGTSQQGHVILSYLEQVGQLGHFARSSKSSLSQSESIQATLERLVFTIHFDCFEGSLLCLAALSTTLPTESRLRHFCDMTLRFRSVIETYLKLRRLSPIAKVAWEICHVVMSSALLLAALEVVLGTGLSGQCLHHLCRAFSPSPASEQSEDDTTPKLWRPGFDTLERLLQLQLPLLPVIAAS